MSPAEFRIRCRVAESCLPDAEYRKKLTDLHDELLAVIEQPAPVQQEPVKWSDYEPDGMHHNKPAQQTGCTWVQPDSDHMPDTWQGACGAVWTFTEGGPQDNDQAYCPKCGGVCIEVRAVEEGGAA